MALDQSEKVGELASLQGQLVLKSLTRRRKKDLAVKGVSMLGALIGLFFLLWILSMVILRGLGSLNWAFFTQLPTPPGMIGGGVANAIVGTVLITILATLIGTPIGILAGVFLAEYGKGLKVAGFIRSVTNLLIGVPSIIVGVFTYTILVSPMKSFSAFAGAVALAIIMLPVVVRTTDDMLNMVPNALRESGLALGAGRRQVTLGIVFRAARSGMLTGVLLAIARVSGETAPLLFTALNSQYWMSSLHEPTANLTVLIFNYAMSPYDDWISKAWGASLLIMMGVLGLSILARIAIRGKGERG